jgi:hypothetical protein
MRKRSKTSASVGDAPRAGGRRELGGLGHQFVVQPMGFLLVGAESDLPAVELDVPGLVGFLGERLGEAGHR